MYRHGVKLVLLAALTVCLWAVWPRGDVTGEWTAPPAEALPAPAETPAWTGVASCAASACHHANGPRGSPRSEYSTWAAHDKHAQAYLVLFSKRSRQIMENYYGDSKPVEERTLCLKCHATGDGTPKVKGPRFQLSDGVGCESCHGAAGIYLSEHYRNGFAEKSDEVKLKEYGLRPTKNLAVRAKICAECHVGDAATGKEVNHDLYAAGHPRLSFEFAAFLAQYPKHWKVEADKERNPDYEARVWALGQVTSAKQSLELLHDRATRAQATKNPAPWPEFAEYDCFACHKTLRPNSPRQQAAYDGRVPGLLPWGTWTWDMANRYAKATGAPLDLKELAALRTEMERPGPNAATVQALVGEKEKLLKSLEAWRQQVEKGPVLKPQDLKSFQAQLLRDDEPRAAALTWDEATQLYLALEALQRGQKDLEKGKVSTEVRAGLRDFRKELTNAFQILGAPDQRVESPANFDPAKLKKPLRALRETVDDK